MKNKNYKANQRGFTLVEVIVVLVILAILAAIAIPAMTGWIDKAKEKRLIVACRTCVNAAQTLVVEQYSIDGSVDAPDSSDIIALAGVEGAATVDAFSQSNKGQIHKLTYNDGTDSVEYDADACETGEYYIFHAGGAHSFGSGADMTAINNSFITARNSQDNLVTQMDSGAAGLEGFAAQSAVKSLQDAGINLSALGAKSWMFRKDATKGNLLMWTNKDISKMDAGDSIVVMQYRIGGEYDGKYSVRNAKVGTVTNDSTGTSYSYNTIVPMNGTALQEGTTDYETALKVYNEKNS